MVDISKDEWDGRFERFYVEFDSDDSELITV